MHEPNDRMLPLLKPYVIICGLKYFPDFRGGVEHGAQYTIENLIDSDFHIVIISRKNNYVTHNIKGVTVRYVKYYDHKYLSYFTYMLSATFCILKYPPKSILHLHNPVVHGIWVPIFRLMGYKVISHSHGLEWRAKKWPSWFCIIMQFSALIGAKFSNEFICISREESDWFKNKGIKKINFIPNGIPKIPTYDFEICNRLNLKENDFWLFVGRLVPQKQVLMLISAFKNASTTKKLVIVGGGSYSGNYERRIKKQCRHSKEIIQCGWLKPFEVYALMKKCLGVVLPSIHEGCPNVLLEAIAIGTICIVSNIKAHREIGNSCFKYVNPESEADLTKVFNDFESDKLNIEYFQKQTMYQRNKLLTWAEVSEKVLNIYSKVS